MDYKVKFKCGCENNTHSMWWLPQKFEYKTSEKGWREIVPSNYVVCIFNSASNRKQINNCPNCGTKVPEPVDTLPEKK